MAVSLYGAFFIVILNTAADLIHAALDPRVRVGGGR
jgi:ABC-type dipeptide/oligopeptide/nickel transport system permease component